MDKQRADLTFKHNLKRGRHGWVRLTPAYSVKVVHQILDDYPDIMTIMDPFSGTGTTGLVAGQRGLYSDLFDVNPFLVWLANVKCANYTPAQLRRVDEAGIEIIHRAQNIASDDDLWFAPISNIDRWWSYDRLVVLGKFFKSLNEVLPTQSKEKDLLLVGFCRLIMRWSNAAFNHQSMSFKEHNVTQRMFDEQGEIHQDFLHDLRDITAAAAEQISSEVRAHLNDSREIVGFPEQYDAVITSPPYVNRMSYVRELRPYMYWLGYLDTPRDAGELDWEAIGGTWGVATSRLNDWMPQNQVRSDRGGLETIVERIAQNSVILSRYVHKYFNDMSSHFASLYDNVAPGGHIFYIIGNSKFYDTVVPAEKLYADLMTEHGFENTKISTIRKRNSKKELYEFLVSARKS